MVVFLILYIIFIIFNKNVLIIPSKNVIVIKSIFSIKSD